MKKSSKKEALSGSCSSCSIYKLQTLEPPRKKKKMKAKSLSDNEHSVFLALSIFALWLGHLLRGSFISTSIIHSYHFFETFRLNGFNLLNSSSVHWTDSECL